MDLDIICLDEIKIKVHKVVMAAASSFFRVGTRIEDSNLWIVWVYTLVIRACPQIMLTNKIYISNFRNSCVVQTF